MKRMLASVCAIILLAGCAKPAPIGTAEQTESSVPANTETAEPKEPEISAALQAYIDEMEPYEVMRIAFLASSSLS